MFFQNENMTRSLRFWKCFSLNRKSDAYWNFQFKFMLFKKAPKMQNMSFSRSKKNQNVIFWMPTFFQNLKCPKIYNSKSNALYFFQSKIWRFVKLYNQNLTGFEIFIPKSDALEKLNSKPDKLKKIFPKSDFYLVFLVLTEWWYFLSTLITTWFKEEK